MLNPFPELLTLQFVIITFLRIILAFLFLRMGYLKLFQDQEKTTEFFRIAKFPLPQIWMYLIGGIEFFGGALLLVGAFVQYVAIVLSVVMFGALILKDRDHPYLKNAPEYYILLFALTFSFLFFGAGAFAFDIPL